MEIVRDIVIVFHLISFALLFGAWLVEAIARRVRITRAMHWGLAAALVTGLALAAPWGLGDGELNYMKIGIKLVVLLAIGAVLGIGAARQKRDGAVPPVLFWVAGALTLANVTIAVLV
ncbi:MAG TPA: Fe-S protein [Candidatus Corynebacterium faecigallinarum]|uniref:Fe-S protein n=1 Tax=Candidatus Corynebacterium faecigallinarum TaxID=2838528 RepID=A0A9D2QCL2_9CORY|nr:Fe-S protein [Candidatus Corynebacterium faecigallinarum]